MSQPGVLKLAAFRRLWLAGTVSEFGTYVTTLSLQVLVVETLHGTALQVGLVNASRWVPYLLFGLVLGALVERRRKRPVLVVADFARALALAAIPALWIVGWLGIPVLMGFVAAFGLFSLLGDAASQSFLPRIVPAPSLLAANARIDQSSAVAQASGPVIAGAVVSVIGAPLAVIVDALSYLFSAITIARIRVAEPVPVVEGRDLLREIGEGLRWVYGHRMLGPIAINTHLWFVFSSMLGTIFIPFALGLGLAPLELGITLAAAGSGALLGSLLSLRLGLRWGAGPAVIASTALMPVGWAVIALAGGGHLLIIVLLAVGQGVFGFALGASNANEMSYRQAITPDTLQGRTNTTMRSFNRAAIIIGAPLGGLLADTIGFRTTLWIAIGGFVVVTLSMLASPLRNARHGDLPDAASARRVGL